MMLGALPAVIVGSCYTLALVLLGINLDAISAAVTPFADTWNGGLALAVRFAIGVSLLAAVVIVAIVSFVGVTLTVGDPFYERIARAVDLRLGDAPAPQAEPFWTGVRRSSATGIRIAILTALVGLAVFGAGLIPVAGPVLSPIIGAVFGGSLLTLETSAFAYDARRISFRERRRMLARRRAATLGFGILTYLLFLVPFGAVLVMPAAVAGATMLARDSLSVQTGRSEAT